MKNEKDSQTNRLITYTLTQTLDVKDLEAVSGATSTVKCTGGGGTGGGSVDCIVDF